MLIRFSCGRVSRLATHTAVFLSGFLILIASAPLCAASKEVAAENKAKAEPELSLGGYRDELLDCSALAAIHMWIGEGLGDDPGAEVRRKINSKYWIDVSKSYLALAEQATGSADLSEELGVRMRALSAQFRDLTEAKVSPEGWDDWYNLIDRCDTWRPDRPRHAFYDNGRKTVADVDRSTQAGMASG